MQKPEQETPETMVPDVVVVFLYGFKTLKNAGQPSAVIARRECGTVGL